MRRTVSSDVGGRGTREARYQKSSIHWRIVESVIARKMWRTLEVYHGAIYFVPEARDAYAELGVTDRMMGYFGSRAAPMGAVPAEVVIATFFNFHPTLIRACVPEAWGRATPARVPAARLSAVDAG